MQPETHVCLHRNHLLRKQLGKKRALQLSFVLHTICAFLIIAASYQLNLRFEVTGWLHWVGTAIFVSLLIYQHLIVKADDLSRINLAFFTTNGVASIVLGTLIILDLFI